MPRSNKNQRLLAIGKLEVGLRHVDVAEHLVCYVALSPVWQHVAEFVELLTAFPAQAHHKVRRQFKTATFGRHIYVIAFYRQRVVVTPSRENDRISA